MSLKIMFIIAGTLISLTIFIFLFTTSPSPDTETSPSEATEVSPVPTMDPSQPPTAGKAKISGVVCASNTIESSPGLMVVAEQIPSRERTTQYIPGPFDQDVAYAMELDPGTYQVYTETPNRTKISLYSRYVACGADPSVCTDHSLVEFQAGANQTLANIDICDYEWTKPLPSPTGVSPSPLSF